MLAERLSVIVAYPSEGGKVKPVTASALPFSAEKRYNVSVSMGNVGRMFILNGFRGTPVDIDFHNGDLLAVLNLLADTARYDGFAVIVDSDIRGKIQIKMHEPWNIILVEILAGVNFITTVVNHSIIISYNLTLSCELN